MTHLAIRPATVDDTDLILHFVRELAIYEKAEQEALATPAHVHRTLFCANPKVHGLICQDGDTPVGFAVYFFNYSTWLGRNGLYLEDLFVRPEHRGRGAGLALLRHLAGIAVARGCGRFEWSVLDWNQPAIDFYRAAGARPMDEWTVYRMDGQALLDFAAGSR